MISTEDNTNDVERLRDEISKLKLAHNKEFDRYAKIYECISDLVFISSFTNNSISNFIDANDFSIELLGYTKGEIIDMEYFNLFITNTNKDIISDLIQNKKTTIIADCKTKNNELKHLSLELSLIYTPNNEQQIITIGKDITDKIITEKELILAKKEAFKYDELRNEFLANVSLEIRTPMSAIVGFANLLAHDNIEHSKKLEYINIINTNTNLLLRLINDIIDLSKLELEQLRVVYKTFNINELITSSYNIFATELKRFNKGHIKLLYSKTLADKDAYIISDPIRIVQVFNNLIFNSIKFTDKGFIEYGYEFTNNNKIRLFVKDSGIGIIEERQDVIFNHFRKSDDEFTARNHGGTGLGLSISKKLVEKLGGKIWVESKKDKGSTFFFELPYFHNQIDDLKIPDTFNSNIDWSGKTILLIDESEYNISILNMALFKTNISLLVARTGEESMHLCKMNPKISAVVLCSKLPDMSWLEASNIINKINPKLPIILKKDSEIDITKTSNIKCTIQKPVSEKELFEKLIEIIN